MIGSNEILEVIREAPGETKLDLAEAFSPIFRLPDFLSILAKLEADGKIRIEGGRVWSI